MGYGLRNVKFVYEYFFIRSYDRGREDIVYIVDFVVSMFVSECM